MTINKKILIFTATYNEAENIGRLLEKLIQQSNNAHILVIDDNSPDRTAEIVESYQKNNQSIFLIKREGKLGLDTAHKKAYESNLITLICLFLFIGAMGKSAQFLLHTWLPDAMEGPTPVSALIHAATMVTAGVFLVVRCSPLFEYSQVALNVVTIVGMITAIFAASIALVQNDIKKIVAYSTCSQLGYMFFAAGVGAYHVAIFHLFTHAFFKALYF